MSKKREKKSPVKWTGADTRQSFLEFFAQRGHTIVPSASLVPGGDQTLLFTNAGMVQFKDVFLGSGTRPYVRAVDCQKCMRVAGKHNDLEDVGRDDTHHTFFEMLGNWSFGDYYKKEAITWAWELLTEVWGLPKDRLYATCFEDEMGEIPRDDEAAGIWLEQPGFHPDHVLFFGRQDNFWEMADTGPCGPDSEIHFDRGPEYCNMQGLKDHECAVNGDCQRYLELWNLVFIQYNRISPHELEPLPAKHVDTGMGFERIVSVLQDVDSNYKTDLFTPLLDTVQRLTGDDEKTRRQNLTPYRVIADHGRAASFLIADGVVPGNVGRNYVCRMIIRRASRFGGMIGLDEPFLHEIAQTVIACYGDFYPELERNKAAILQTLNEEERRFHRTIDVGVAHFMTLMEQAQSSDSKTISGQSAFDLYATYGLPFEITRDLAVEHGFTTDEAGFYTAMEQHRLASGDGSGKDQTDENIDLYRQILEDLQSSKALGPAGVDYDPYASIQSQGDVLALIRGDERVQSVREGERVEVVLPETSFYVESGGQVTDTGEISAVDGASWEIEIERAREPVKGLILHEGKVVRGNPQVGDLARASIDADRRLDIMRNHTATHLLHAALREVLGEHARQAGSLVAPDHLRFDFTHPEAMTPDEIQLVQEKVSEAILANYKLTVVHKSRQEAIDEGAMALFGETYGEVVRTVSIGEDERHSYELCGGTHVDETGIIGPFLVLSEGSVAAGIRRIEAVTGRKAQSIIDERLRILQDVAAVLDSPIEEIDTRIRNLLAERDRLERERSTYLSQQAIDAFDSLEPQEYAGVRVLSAMIPDADAEILRQLTDRFRDKYDSGVVLLGSIVDGRPILVAAVSADLVTRNLNASKLVKLAAKAIGGGGGGKATLAQAGGKDASKLNEALDVLPNWVESELQ